MCDFENFKSSVCHMLKFKGDMQFIIDILEDREVDRLFKKGCYKESLYMLAMLDYVCRVNDLPLCYEYDALRECQLSKIIFPRDVLLMSRVFHDLNILKKAWDDAIPEFKRHNIVENEVRNVA